MKIVTRMIEDEVYEAVTDKGIAVTIDMRLLPQKQNQSLMLNASLFAVGRRYSRYCAYAKEKEKDG